ncbi:MAG: pyridoxamine 5'-phosphate oxidase family protein [Actinomycetota bacterium]|nr:pyridoxamine 5'-phosphate oxidase family protein [Actinomycetota bacterium]
MGKTFPSLSPDLAEFVAASPVFFVATAPLAADGHVNVSPKGGDTLRVLDERTVAYLDLTGSGAETIAHLRENARITLMACAFEGPPRIVRLYGTGEAVLADDARFAALVACFPPLSGVRSVVVIALERVSTSCGFGVPLMRVEGDRDLLEQWARRKGPEGIASYQAERNATSIDGLPAVPPPAQDAAASSKADKASSS